MKRILAVFLALILCLSVCGCLPAQEYHASTTEPNQEIVVAAFDMEKAGSDPDGYFVYYRDTVTDVLYIRYREKSGYAGMGGLIVMLDPETGLPLTYARYCELYEQMPEGTE